MYNEKLKQQYIESVNLKPDFSEDDLALTINIFQTSEKYEEKFGKDLAYFNADEVKNVYLDFGYGTRYNNLRLQKFINMYIRYVKKEHDSSIILSKIPPEMMKDIILHGIKNDGFYMTEETFLSLVESLAEGYNSQLAFVFLAAYNGLGGDYWSEISLVKEENINSEKQTINIYTYDKRAKKVYYSRTIKVNDLFLKIATLANAETESKRSKGFVNGKYKTSDYILKKGENAGEKDNIEDYVFSQYRRSMDMLIRFRKNPDYAFPEISLEDIRNSGIINFLKKLMKAFDEPMDRRESAINNPYVAKPIMEKFNIDEFSIKKIIMKYMK